LFYSRNYGSTVINDVYLLVQFMVGVVCDQTAIALSSDIKKNMFHQVKFQFLNMWPSMRTLTISHKRSYRYQCI